MKLEVGMYVRGKYYQYRGKIGKIIKNYNNDLEIAYANGVLKTTVGSFLDDNTDINGRQYKASYNIMDLIEVGDYVNGEKVLLKNEGYIKVGTGRDYIVVNNEKFIKSIVTKEQFESIKYSLEG